MASVSSNGRRALRRSLLLSCAVSAALSAYAGAAFAGDLTISTAVTNPVSTSVGDGGGAGSVIITPTGSVKLDATDVGPAVTLDSGAESVTNNGSIIAGVGTLVQNAGQNGILVTADTTGGVTNNGTIKTGTTQVTDSAGVITTPGVGADEAVLIQGSLGTGFNNIGSISTIASATNPYAVLIESNLTAITFGVIDAGTAALNYGIHNKGTIYSIGYIDGNAAIGMGFAGLIAAPISVPGINNETGGTIQATSAEEDATAIEIGAFTSITGPGIVNGGVITGGIVSATSAGTAKGIHIAATGSVTEIANSGTISASSSGAAGGDAIAIDVDALGSLTTITNNTSSSIFATASHDNDDATAIRDQSGTLATIANAGSISATTSATGTGAAVAIDLSLGAGNTIINNTGNIVGQIKWGAGNYQLNASDGIIISDLSINAGTAVVNLTGDTVMTAASSLIGGGLLTVNAGSGTTLESNAGDFNVTNITFDSGATYAVSYDTATATPSGHIKAGTATLHDGAIIDVTLTSYLGAATPTITVVETSTALNFDTPGDPSGLVIGGIGAGYNAVLATGGSDLTISLSRKTATQLGLSGNAAAIYDASVDGLEADTTFGAAVGNLSTVDAVTALYNQLLPDLSSAREQQAIRMQDVTAGFINDRLNLMRTADQGAGNGGGQYRKRYNRAGLWLQEGVSSEKGDGGIGTQGYDGTLYALSLGYDTRDEDGDVWGVSLTYASMAYDAGLSTEDSAAKTTMAQVYHSLNRGVFFWDAMGSAAWNTYETNRTAIAGTVGRTATADWSGYQAGLSSQVGVAGTLGPITIRPSAGLAYTYLSQGGYEEEGGGAAMNLNVDSSTFSSLRANAELRVSGIISKEPQIVPYVRGGISQELMDTDQETTGSFASSGTPFTLQNAELDSSVPFVGAGISFVGGYSRLSFEYTGQLGSKFTSHQGVATASIMF